MLTLTTPFSDAWEILKSSVSVPRCQYVIDFWEDYIKANRKATFAQAIKAIPDGLVGGKEAGDKWARWVLVNFGDQLEIGVKLAFLLHVNSPLSKFLIWKNTANADIADRIKADWVQALPEIAKEHG